MPGDTDPAADGGAGHFWGGLLLSLAAGPGIVLGGWQAMAVLGSLFPWFYRHLPPPVQLALAAAPLVAVAVLMLHAGRRRRRPLMRGLLTGLSLQLAMIILFLGTCGLIIGSSGVLLLAAAVILILLVMGAWSVQQHDGPS